MFSDLNEKQKEAVFAGDGPLLIVAGAGSGKTKTLTSRIVYLISEKNISPENILAITFTNRAADEMKSRVLKSLSSNGIKIDLEPYISTFHSFGAFVLRSVCTCAGRTKSFSIYDKDDSNKLIKNIIKDKNLEKNKKVPFFTREFSRIKSECMSKDSFDGDDITWEVYEEYEYELKKNNAFDFDDLIQKVVSIFRTHPEVLEKYTKRFSHILVDEYQDVNTSQYLMLRLLAGKKNNITVVGDDAQSIYRFRFSDFRNFLNFEKDWPNSNVVFLEQNYRSSKNIIEASSNLILRNTQQKRKKLWTENTEGTPVQIIEHDNEFTEANFITSKAQSLNLQGMHVGILFRTNAQSRALEQMFVECGTQYHLFGAVSFYDRREIRDILSALRYANNPLDSVSLERLHKNLYKKDFDLVKKTLPESAKTMSPADLVRYFVEIISYPAYLQSEFSNFVERIENVGELEYFAEQFDSLGELLEKISLVDSLSESDKSNHDKRKKRSRHDHGNTIDLMTIHLAKGLEFDVVFVAGVNEGLLPHGRSYSSEEELEEERRLMYVAMTRAKRELYLNFYKVPSRFLLELPGDKVIFHGDKSLNDEERFIEYD